MEYAWTDLSESEQPVSYGFLYVAEIERITFEASSFQPEIGDNNTTQMALGLSQLGPILRVKVTVSLG